MAGFCTQEFIISGLYILETRRILRPRAAFLKDQTRKAMWHLIYVNAFIVLMDVALLSTEFTNQYDIQVSFKSAVYSVKLQLEFAILNQLVNLVQDSGGMSKNRGFHSWSQGRGGASLPGAGPGGNGSMVELHKRTYSVESQRAAVDNRQSWRHGEGVKEIEPAKRNGTRVVKTEITIQECACGGLGRGGGVGNAL